MKETNKKYMYTSYGHTWEFHRPQAKKLELPLLQHNNLYHGKVLLSSFYLKGTLLYFIHRLERRKQRVQLNSQQRQSSNID